MKYRKFGRLGWMVSEIGYGMWLWGMVDWDLKSEEEVFRALQKSVDLGCNFFDTAWGYGEGKSERLLGQLVAENQGKKLFIATKIPPKNRQWPSRRNFLLDDCFPPEYIEEYVNKSLNNLNRSNLDLIQLHVWEDSWVEDDRWINKLWKMKDQGLFGGIGISLNRWEPWNGIKAVKSGMVDSVQVIYNIFDQNPEDELFPACCESDVAIIARVPFDEGTLSGTLTKQLKWPDSDWRSTYFKGQNLVSSVDRAERLREILPPEMTLPETALRFVLSNSDVSTVIPGMRKEKHVLMNISMSDKGPVEAGLQKELRKHRWERNLSDWYKD